MMSHTSQCFLCPAIASSLSSSPPSLHLQATPIDPEVMTPVQHYVLFYGIPGSSEGLSSVTTPDGMASGHDITQGGNMTVGVAEQHWD